MPDFRMPELHNPLKDTTKIGKQIKEKTKKKK